jgi:hypothetical protein
MPGCCAPIAKPLASKAAAPAPPPASSHRPCVRFAGSSEAQAASSNATAPLHSHGRSPRAACHAPLAAPASVNDASQGPLSCANHGSRA